MFCGKIGFLDLTAFAFELGRGWLDKPTFTSKAKCPLDQQEKLSGTDVPSRSHALFAVWLSTYTKNGLPTFAFKGG